MNKPTPCMVWLPADHRLLGDHGHQMPFLLLGDKYARAVKVGAECQPVMFPLADSAQIPELLPYDQLDAAMDSGRFTFVIDIPANFQADLLAGRQPALQVNVDATAMSQAFMGAGYIGRIFQRELLDYSGQADTAMATNRGRVSQGNMSAPNRSISAP